MSRTEDGSGHYLLTDELEHLPNSVSHATIVTANAVAGTQARQAGKKVIIIDDLLNRQTVEEIDREVIKMIRRFTSAVEHGEQLEYSLTPLLIQAGKFTRLLEVLLKMKPTRLTIYRSGPFSGLAERYCRHHSIEYQLLKPSLLNRYRYASKQLEFASRTKWRNSRIRNLLLEPAWQLSVLLRSRFRSSQDVAISDQKPLLIVAADRFTLPVYQKLMAGSHWRAIIAGKTFPGRQLFKNFTSPWLEEAATWGEIVSLPRRYFQAKKVISASIAKQPDLASYHGFDLWPIIGLTIRVEYGLITSLNQVTSLALGRSGASAGKSVLLLSNDVTDYNRALVATAKKLSIPSVVIQHGLLLEPNGHNRILADRLAGWGEATKDWYRQHSNSLDKIVITGNPRFDDIPSVKKSTEPSQKPYILIGTDFVIGFSAEDTYLKNQLLLECVSRLARSPLGKKYQFYLSNHPGEDKDFYNDFFTSHPEITRVPKLPWHQLLANAATYISNYSTAIIEAIDLGTPVVMFNLKFQRSLVPAFRPPLVLLSDDYQSLQGAVNDALIRKRQRSEELKAVKYFLGNRDGQATERVATYLGSLVKHQ